MHIQTNALSVADIVRRRFLGLGLLVCGWLLSSSTKAQEATEVYDVNWPVDLSVTAVATAGWLVPPLLVNHLVTPSCPCDSQSVLSIDRGVVGVQHKVPAVTSNILIATVYGLGAVLDGVDTLTETDGTLGFLQDIVVMGEAVAITGAMTELTKMLVTRPRPLVYGLPAGDPELSNTDNYTSFFSGHTSGAFAVGMSYAQTFALRHPHSPYRFFVYGAAILLGGTVGTLRVVSGKHFPTDVLTGAVVGSGVGLLVPWLHRRSQEVQLSLQPFPGGVVLTVALNGR